MLCGCINRYEAPTAPLPVETPYSALALYRGVSVPVGEGDPLPVAAARLAWKDDQVFADTALLEPGPGAIAESWPDALALLRGTEGPIIALVDEADVASLCAQVGSLAPRIARALRPDETALYPMIAREAPGERSPDPLVGAPLRCPTAEAP